MNTQEHTLLTNLLNNLRETANTNPSVAKDPEAAQLINETLTAAPDSAYLLVQRHLLLEMALERAQARIQALQPGAPSSFLGGQATHITPGNSPTQTNAYGQPIGQAASAPASPSVSSASASASAPPSTFSGGSFLGTAAATATGVLGGALLFQGIEHLMGDGLGGGRVASGLPTEDVTNITENFYGTPPDMNAGMNTGGWDNTSMADADSGTAFDGPAANPIDPTQSDNSGLFDQIDTGDSGGGLFDGLFGGGDDDWV